MFVLIFHFQIFGLFWISYGDLTSELHKGDNATRKKDIDTFLLSSSLSLIGKNECCPSDSVSILSYNFGKYLLPLRPLTHPLCTRLQFIVFLLQILVQWWRRTAQFHMQ